ncbi:MAG: squalene/phytoene synthase family protein [Balneolaceae bacterium]
MRYPYSLIRPFYEKTAFHNAVIDELEDRDLQHAYRHCRGITRKYARTFYLATRFLPYSKQRSIFAIYALCRYLDDLVDEAEDLIRNQSIDEGSVGRTMTKFSRKLLDTYQGIIQDDPILFAFSDVLRKYHISIQLPLELIDGVMMDLTKNRYDTFEELYGYSYKVAAVVGLMTSEVFGYKDPKALDYAVDLGIAMQLTNILRDVGEDLSRDRIYLPQDELRQFRVSEKDLMERNLSQNVIDLLRFQIQRARSYYERADTGIPMLSGDSRLPVCLARENYSRILDKIEENGYQVFHRRAYLTTSEKLAILPRILYRLQIAE